MSLTKHKTLRNALGNHTQPYRMLSTVVCAVTPQYIHLVGFIVYR